jgi:hypothetical protein
MDKIKGGIKKKASIHVLLPWENDLLLHGELISVCPFNFIGIGNISSIISFPKKDCFSDYSISSFDCSYNGNVSNIPKGIFLEIPFIAKEIAIKEIIIVKVEIGEDEYQVGMTEEKVFDNFMIKEEHITNANVATQTRDILFNANDNPDIINRKAEEALNRIRDLQLGNIEEVLEQCG